MSKLTIENGVDSPSLPKRFMLMPSDGALKVVHAAQCVGYVWTEQNRWWARSREGALLDTGSGNTVLEAVLALFAAQNEPQPLTAR